MTTRPAIGGTCCRSTGCTRFRRDLGPASASAPCSTTGRSPSSAGFTTGAPESVTFTTTDNFDFTGGGDAGRVSVRPGCDPILPRGERSHERWFNTSCFIRPSGRGDEGNSSRVHYFGPGSNTWDLTLTKERQARRLARSAVSRGVLQPVQPSDVADRELGGAVRPGRQPDQRRVRNRHAGRIAANRAARLAVRCSETTSALHWYIRVR